MTVHRATCAGSMHLPFNTKHWRLHLHPVELQWVIPQPSQEETAESSTTPAHSIRRHLCQSALLCQTVRGQSQYVPTQHPNNRSAPSGPSRLLRPQILVRLSLRARVRAVAARKCQHQRLPQRYQPRGHVQMHHGQMRRLPHMLPPVHRPRLPPQPRARRV